VGTLQKQKYTKHYLSSKEEENLALVMWAKIEDLFALGRTSKASIH
jgi:hypothetical protein